MPSFLKKFEVDEDHIPILLLKEVERFFDTQNLIKIFGEKYPLSDENILILGCASKRAKEAACEEINCRRKAFWEGKPSQKKMW